MTDHNPANGTVTVADVIAAAEEAIESAQAGWGGVLDLREPPEHGSDAWDLAETMRVHLELIEDQVAALDEAVVYAESELRQRRREFDRNLR